MTQQSNGQPSVTRGDNAVVFHCRYFFDVGLLRHGLKGDDTRSNYLSSAARHYRSLCIITLTKRKMHFSDALTVDGQLENTEQSE